MAGATGPAGRPGEAREADADREAAAAARRIAQTTSTLIAGYPFLATLLLRLARLPDPAARTMWTDGTRLGYSPAFVLSLHRDELLGVLAHEVLHVAALHPWRQGTRDPQAWNVACDQVVNHIAVDEMGLRLPTGSVPGVAGKAAEELYVAPPPVPPAPDPASPGGGGEGTPPPPKRDPGGCGEVRSPAAPDGAPLGEADREAQLRETRVAVRQALNAAKRAGLLPAGLARFVADGLAPRVPWEEILARFLDERARHDYSWSRPDRRYVQAGILLPGLRSQAYGRVVMGCDTSGSIDAGQLRAIGSEVLGAMEAYAARGQSPELTVAWFDTAVYPQVVERTEDLRPVGGGGTSFRVVFEWVATLPEPPRALVMVTDGHCGDFGRDPGIPVLWILTARNRGFRPPFGEVVHVMGV